MLLYTHEERRTMDAPPEDVFAMLADLPTHAEWSGSGEVKAVRVLTEGPVGPGTEWEADEEIHLGSSTKSFVAHSEISAFAPPYKVSWRSEPPSKPKMRRIEWTYQLQPAGAGRTEVVERVEVDGGPLLNAVMRLPYKRMRGHYVAEGMQRTLDNLADRCH